MNRLEFGVEKAEPIAQANAKPRPRWREKSTAYSVRTTVASSAEHSPPNPRPSAGRKPNSSFYSILPTSTPRTPTFFVLNRKLRALSRDTSAPLLATPQRRSLSWWRSACLRTKCRASTGDWYRDSRAPTDPLAVRTCSRKAGTSHKASSFSPLPPVPSPRLHKGKTFDKRDCENWNIEVSVGRLSDQIPEKWRPRHLDSIPQWIMIGSISMVESTLDRTRI